MDTQIIVAIIGAVAVVIAAGIEVLKGRAKTAKNESSPIIVQNNFFNSGTNKEIEKRTNEIKQETNEMERETNEIERNKSDVPEWEKKVADWENQYGVKFQAYNVCDEISKAFLVRAIEYDFLVKHLYVSEIIKNHDPVTVGLLTELEVRVGISKVVLYLDEFYNRLLEKEELYRWICLNPQEKHNRLNCIVRRTSVSIKKRIKSENRKCKEYITNNPQVLEAFPEDSSLKKFIALNNYYEPIINQEVPKINEFIHNSKVKYHLLNKFYEILNYGPNVLKGFLNIPYKDQEQELKKIEDGIAALCEGDKA